MDKRGHAPVHAEVIQRYFEDLPLADAEADLYIRVTKEDIDQSMPGDPSRCAIAVGCRRQYGSTAVLIFRTVAYIDLEGIVRKFEIPQRTLDAIIRQVDAGLHAQPGLFLLKKPRFSNTIAQRQEHTRRRNERERLGLVPKRRGSYPPKKPREFVVAGEPGFLRNGAGSIRTYTLYE